ncbi:hypothetical protein CKQ90_34720, partial [Klebsiella pneumoniae]
FVRFSPSVSLRRMADEHGTDKIIAQKLARVARRNFSPSPGSAATSFVRFSPSVSLRRMADEHGTDKIIAQKLARVAR